MIDKNLTVHPALRGTVLNNATTEVTLPSGTEYFVIEEEGGAGAIRWGVSQAYAESATQYHEVSASGTSGVIAANPPSVFLHAEGGNIDYYIFCVRQGKT